MNNLIGIIVSFIFVFLLIGLSTILSNKGLISNEGSRKFIHIGVSNWWIIAMIFFNNKYFASIVPACFVIINYISYKKQVFKAMERDGKINDFGTVYYAISLLILSLLTFSQGSAPFIGGIGILIMGYGDGFAAIIGKKYGKNKYKIFGNIKSIQGSLTMLAFSFAICTFLLSIYYPNNLILNSIIISAGATVVEAVSPFGIDNLTVPLISSLIFILIK